MIAHTYALQKRGNEPDDYEDALSVDTLRGRFALADGASESCFSREWAEILVGSQNRPLRWDMNWQEWLPELQAQWWRVATDQPHPWYLERKVQEGAFSTLLTLDFDEDCWHASAVGDSCLFQVRGNQSLGSFPMKHSDDFNAHPNLIGSKMSGGDSVEEISQHCMGRCDGGDCFYLATDALAQWAMRENENGKSPWEKLRSLGTEPANECDVVIKGMRNTLGLSNDDVTLLVVTV